MDNIDAIWLGYVRDGWIGSAVLRISGALPELPVALISCIDSSRGSEIHSFTDLDVIRDVARHWGGGLFELVPAGVLISSDAAAELQQVRYNMFNGFDEIWFFGSFRSDLSTVPPPITSESPLSDVGDIDIRKHIHDWISREGAILGLGDGGGLNFVSRTKALATMIQSQESDPAASPSKTPGSYS